MNRRTFLALMGSAGAASALGVGAGESEAAGTGVYPYFKDSYGVLHDTTRCIGCRQCEQGCQKVNNLPLPERPLDDLSVLEHKRRTTARAWTVVNKYTAEDGKVVFRKLQCLHCQDPACASACFAKCFSKNPDGSVTYDGSQCVGCRYCMIACPFYVPGFQYDEPFDPLVQKCTFCAPRLQEGKLPGCVESCPMDALTFGKRSDLVKIARKRIEDNPERYVDYIYGEHDAGGTAWLTLCGVRPETLGMDTHLGNRPMGELTYGALGSVPMIIGFWPLLFGGVYGITRLRNARFQEERDAMVNRAVACVAQKQGAVVAAEVKRALEDAEHAPNDADGTAGGECGDKARREEV